MNVNEEIQKCFANSEEDQAIKISSLPSEYSAYVVRTQSSFGVAIKYQGEKISEEFANAYIYTDFRNIGGDAANYLFLMSDIESTRNQFASICADFVNPGEDGLVRKNLLKNPLSWWNDWKNLIGNAIKEKKPYSVLGELTIYQYLRKQGMTPRWAGPSFSTHDIIAENEEEEVKSTTNRYEALIKVSGQFQLIANKKLFLYFCRFEENENGKNINDLVQELISDGETEEMLENQLSKLGYYQGSSARKIKYKILEVRRYEVDDSFPAITPDSFKNGLSPAIKQITYNVDLDFLPYDLVDIMY
jgi:hypothetical protein